MATEKSKKPTKKVATKKPATKKKPVTKKKVTSKKPTTAKKKTATKSSEVKSVSKKTETPINNKPPLNLNKDEHSVFGEMADTVMSKVTETIETYRSAESSKSTGDGGKADVVKRLVAKLVDLLIAYAFVELDSIAGFLIAITYILTSDGFSGGSIGKRLFGVKVVTRVTKRPVNLMESAIRNAVFAAVIIVYFTIGFIPYIGKLIALASVIAIGVMEVMLILNDKDGIRYGDKLAGTMVVDRVVTSGTSKK